MAQFRRRAGQPSVLASAGASQRVRARLRNFQPLTMSARACCCAAPPKWVQTGHTVCHLNPSNHSYQIWFYFNIHSLSCATFDVSTILIAIYIFYDLQ